VFQGGTEGGLLADLKRDFAVVRHVKPAASRADSSELYVLATGFRGPSADPVADDEGYDAPSRRCRLRAREPDLVITGARVLSTYSERILPDREIWIAGGRIAAVKPAGR
jgi:hypothetical protein